jgi:hypothetical protein
VPSILDRCAGGSLLEPPKDLEPDYRGTKSDSDAIRQRILADLLPYQQAVCEDEEHRIVGFVAGYGAGKSRTMCAWTVLLSLDNPNTLGVMFAPTGPLVRDVVIRTMEDFLEQYEIPYEFRASPLPEFKLLLPEGPVSVLCRSMENWSRIIGLNASFICADEIDTSKIEIARRAVDKFLGRLRAGNRRQLGLFSTPEGFGILYSMFVEEGDKADRALYKGRTADNPHLPPDFLEAMRENYSPALFKSYTEGEFCLLTQAAVYPEFDRHLNRSEQNAPSESDTLWTGVDFNVDRCVMAVCVQQADGIHVIREHVARDTPGVIEVLRQEYQPWIDHGQLIVCPDASSQSRSTKNAGISDFGLMKQAGLRVQTQSSNPFIRDRVLTLNTLILNAKGERKLFVHPDCKLMLRGLEQHAYDQATQQPQKGDGGVDDLSGQMDALGYATWQMAGIKSWKTGGTSWRVY